MNFRLPRLPRSVPKKQFDAALSIADKAAASANEAWAHVNRLEDAIHAYLAAAPACRSQVHGTLRGNLHAALADSQDGFVEGPEED